MWWCRGGCVGWGWYIDCRGWGGWDCIKCLNGKKNLDGEKKTLYGGSIFGKEVGALPQKGPVTPMLMESPH